MTDPRTVAHPARRAPRAQAPSRRRMSAARAGDIAGTFSALVLGAALYASLPAVVHAQPSVGAMPATYIGRATTTAERVSANVARAEAVTADSSTMSATPAAAPRPGTASPDSPATSADTTAITPTPAVADGEPAPARAGEGASPLITFDREVYSYAAEGRRDPFRSLMTTGDLRPLISDLRLVAVAYDPDGASVAILRDIDTNEQYRVRAGNQLGRMRVAAIQSRKVVFTIEEFGFSRQESLALGDPTNARTQR